MSVPLANTFMMQTHTWSLYCSACFFSSSTCSNASFNFLSFWRNVLAAACFSLQMTVQHLVMWLDVAPRNHMVEAYLNVTDEF